MSSIEDQLGIDTSDPKIRRATYNAEANFELLAALVRVRKARGLTQTDLAAKLGVSQASIAAFERPGNDPKLSTIRKYANAVEALVSHEVEEDSGQLSDYSDFWKPLAISMPMLVAVDLGSGWSGLITAGEQTQAHFSLAR